MHQPVMSSSQAHSHRTARFRTFRQALRGFICTQSNLHSLRHALHRAAMSQRGDHLFLLLHLFCICVIFAIAIGSN